MKLEDQVCSLELAKKLGELGVKQKSLWWWTDEGMGGKWHVIPDDQEFWDGYYLVSGKYRAYTVAELGELLPVFDSFSRNHRTSWDCQYQEDSGEYVEGCPNATVFEYANTEANARAKMLIYLLEKKVVKL